MLVLVAAPSSAAPARSITLTPSDRAASWNGDFRVGPYVTPSVCDVPALGCETTLIRLTRPGALSIATTQRLPTNAVGGRLYLGLLHSDAKGAAGKHITAKQQRSGRTASLVAPSLAAGYYLLEVTWDDLTLDDYEGTASYLPR